MVLSLLVTSVLLPPWMVNCLFKFRIIPNHILLLRLTVMLLPQLLQLSSIFQFYSIKIDYSSNTSSLVAQFFCHRNMQYIQHMFFHVHPFTSPKFSGAANGEIPKCETCEYVKAHRHTTRCKVSQTPHKVVHSH